MGRYFTPPPGSSYSPPHWLEHTGDALAQALSTYSAVRGMKQDEADRIHRRERQADADDYRDSKAAIDDHIYRGARPVDQTSVVSGIGLRGVGRPTPYNPNEPDPLRDAMMEQEGGFGGESSDLPAFADALTEGLRRRSPGGGQGGGFTPEGVQMPLPEEAPSSPADRQLPGSYDLATGAFRLSPLLQQAQQYRQLTGGRYQDVGAQRRAQEEERQRELAQLDEELSVRDRHESPRIPSQHDRIAARVRELQSQGKPLAAASRQARLEFGLTDGDGNGRGGTPTTPQAQARKDLPLYRSAETEARRDVTDAERDAPLRREYTPIAYGGLAQADSAFRRDSTSYSPLLEKLRGVSREQDVQEDSVRHAALGLPWERERGPMNAASAREMDAAFAAAATRYQRMLDRGVPVEEAQSAYNAKRQQIVEQYGARTVGGRR